MSSVELDLGWVSGALASGALTEGLNIFGPYMYRYIEFMCLGSAYFNLCTRVRHYSNAKDLRTINLAMATAVVLGFWSHMQLVLDPSI